MALSLGAMAVIFAMAPVTDGGPVLEGAAGPIALVVRQPVRRVLRRLVGPSHVGHAR
jgi:hypothetical protein